MKFEMAKNSLFAILLRSPWWISVVLALVLGVAGYGLLPEPYRAAGALSGAPFLVIAAMALRKQWHVPSAASVAATEQALSAMPWPAFAELLEQAFQRDGYTVQRGTSVAVDFELQRQGRLTVVSARRWKSARTGLEALRALQAARDSAEAQYALYIGLGAISDNARPYAAQHGITLWQSAELCGALRNLPMPAAKSPPAR